MRKIFFILSFILVASIAIAGNRTGTILPGFTELSKSLALDASDTIHASGSDTIAITCINQYLMHQAFTVNLVTVSGSPSVTITAYGKVTLNGGWTQIGTPITWTSASNNGTITSTAPLNYNWLRVVLTCSGATQKVKLTVFEPKLTKVYNIGSASAYVLGVSTGTMAITSSDWAISATGIMTGMGASTFDGKITATGGLGLATNSTVYWAKGGSTVLATSGTDAACTNGGRFWVELEIPYNISITGLAYLVGSVGGTDSVVVQLCNSAGVQVATSRAPGTAAAIVGTAAQFQSVAFTTPYAAVAGKYFAVIQFNGTTAKFRTYPIPGSKFIANTTTGTWGTKADITPGTSFVADKGPIIQTY